MEKEGSREGVGIYFCSSAIRNDTGDSEYIGRTSSSRLCSKASVVSSYIGDSRVPGSGTRGVYEGVVE